MPTSASLCFEQVQPVPHASVVTTPGVGAERCDSRDVIPQE
eukprot:CAMPEP_0198222732 /NCGR_PEP_ID=MMETSP1445-20131203/89401_1 /TAXON_ID=36898 /ORGANISM="Pyramimonas sp., Strain CCMP2087" /LENGTH=40 /DNA_ID= /DNA_START= /DNA_END= /DNA_ORIENTATION=